MCNIISQLFTCCGHKQFQNIYQCDLYTSSSITASNSSCSSFPRVLPDRIPPQEYLGPHRTSTHEGKEGKDLAAIAGNLGARTRPVTAEPYPSETERRCPNLRRPSRPVGGFCGNCIRRRRLLRLHGGSGGSCCNVGGRLGLGDLPSLPRLVLDSPPSGSFGCAAGSAGDLRNGGAVIEEEEESQGREISVVQEEGREGGTVMRRDREGAMGSVSSSSDHAGSTDGSATLIMGASSTVPEATAGGDGQPVLQGRGIGVAI